MTQDSKMAMKKVAIVLILFFSLGLYCLIFSQTVPPGQIERSQEILEQEKALRERLAEDQKLFIKKIIVKGVTLLNKDQVKEIILPFKKHWLSKEDINQILELIKEAYIQRGYAERLPKISYQIENKCLKITVSESSLTH